MTDLLDTFIENRWIVNPNHANNLEAAHGGNVMKWMDEVAAMAAMRCAGQTCVTASMDQVNFKRPIPVGDVALVQGYAYETGKTSVKVRSHVYREDPKTGEQEATTESYFVFVAIDESGTPVEVPDLAVESERGRSLREQAVAGENGNEVGGE